MSEVDNKVKMIVEGLLLAAGRPLSLDNIAQVFSKSERPDRKELKAVMDAISEECDDRGFELTEVASGFRFQVKQELSEWVAKLWEDRPPRYTRALLETLALIAYRQPITRGDIEEIRGVGVSSNIIRTLLDREWVRVVGHRDVPGKPAMFATTKQFLDYFDLKSLQELPPLAEIKEMDKTEEEINLGEELAQQRIIDLPEDAVDEASFEHSELSDEELLAEEEAIELSKKPLDEILDLHDPDADEEAEGDEGEDAEANESDEEEEGESFDISDADDETATGEDALDDDADSTAELEVDLEEVEPDALDTEGTDSEYQDDEDYDAEESDTFEDEEDEDVSVEYVADDDDDVNRS